MEFSVLVRPTMLAALLDRSGTSGPLKSSSLGAAGAEGCGGGGVSKIAWGDTRTVLNDSGSTTRASGEGTTELDVTMLTNVESREREQLTGRLDGFAPKEQREQRRANHAGSGLRISVTH